MASKVKQELKVLQLKKEIEQLSEEERHHRMKAHRLIEKLERLYQQHSYATDQQKKIQLRQEIKLTCAKRNLEQSKEKKVNAERWQKHYEQRKIEGYYVTKDDIQNQKRIVAEHEIAVKKAEAVVKKLEKEEEQCEESVASSVGATRIKSHPMEAEVEAQKESAVGLPADVSPVVKGAGAHFTPVQTMEDSNGTAIKRNESEERNQEVSEQQAETVKNKDILTTKENMEKDDASQAPVVTKQPQSQSIFHGDCVTLSVMATGSDPLSYQWRKDGQLITKEDSSMKQFNTPNLYIHPFSPKHDGNYQCLVTNSFGSTISQAAEMKGLPPLLESQIDGYTCVARSILGFVYLPDTVHGKNVDIQSIYDATMHPKVSPNEILLTPVVSITSCGNLSHDVDQPVVIELVTSVTFHPGGNRKIMPMFSNTCQSVSPCWESLTTECDLLEDRVRFKTTHFSFFAVVVQFSPPTASISIDPTDLESVDTGSHVKLTITEMPGFNVVIPSESVQSATEVTATLFYDDSEQECKGKMEQPLQLASACVLLEPHGQSFSKKVSVDVPIPGYSKIIAANPNAKPRLLYSPSGSSNDWEVHEDLEIRNVGDDFVATFYIDHFSWWKLIWPEGLIGVAEAIGTIFKHVKSLGSRCQVFMTRETDVGAVINFSIQVLVYPFQDTPQEIPPNYHYMLYDSGSQQIKFAPGLLKFSLELKGYLHPLASQKLLNKSHTLSVDYAARTEFDIDLEKISDSGSRLKEGAVLAHLSVADCSNDGTNVHECNLIKLYQSEVYATKLTDISPVSTIYLPSLTATTKIGEENVSKVIKCLWPARLKWREIGLSLKIDPTTLEVIRRSSHNVDDCFTNVILRWFRKGKPVPCWKILAEILSSPPVEVPVEEREEDNRKCNENKIQDLIEIKDKGDQEDKADEVIVEEFLDENIVDGEIEPTKVFPVAAPVQVVDKIQVTDSKEDSSSINALTDHDSSEVKREVEENEGSLIPGTDWISPWLFISVGGIVVIGLVWLLKRWRK